MTKERSQDLPRRSVRTDDLPAVRDLAVGKYTFLPGGKCSAPVVQGTVIGDGARVERQVTEPLLREFFALLEKIQEELNSRWNDQEYSGHQVDHARRAPSYG